MDKKREALVKARNDADKAWANASNAGIVAHKAWNVADKAWDDARKAGIVAHKALRDYDDQKKPK